MALFCRRIISQQLFKRSVTAVPCMSRGYSWFNIPEKTADPLDHATGIEKQEMLARLAGNDDPFDMKVAKRGPGTKEQPNLVGSYFDSRLIGCICEEEQTHINWMWLHKGYPRRCGECGAWYKLVERKDPYKPQ